MKTTARLFGWLCALWGVMAAEETLQSFHVQRGGDDYRIQLRRQTDGDFKGAYYFVVTLPQNVVRFGRWSDSDLNLLALYEVGEPETFAHGGIVIVSMAGGESAHAVFMLRSAPKKSCIPHEGTQLRSDRRVTVRNQPCFYFLRPIAARLNLNTPASGMRYREVRKKPGDVLTVRNSYHYLLPHGLQPGRFQVYRETGRPIQ